MSQLNKLLNRQIKRTIGLDSEALKNMQDLFLLISKSYDQFERDRVLVERSLELSSAEFIEKNKEIEEASIQLIKSNEELEKYAYIAAHDLKEPLRSIGGFTQLIGLRLADQIDEKTDEYMKHILKNVDHMNRLLDDIMQYSKLTMTENRSELVEISTIIENILLNFKKLPKEQMPTFFIPESLPVLQIERSKIYQIFQNLISNAFKYRSEKRPHIKVELEQNKAYIIFTVKDNGIGIDDQFKEEVFTLFKTLNNKLENKGNGIGLAICKKIIEEYGGEIWIDKSYNNGTAVKFTLPKSLLSSANL